MFFDLLHIRVKMYFFKKRSKPVCK